MTIVQNQGTMVEYIDVERSVNGKPEKDTITVQAGGKVELPRGWKLSATWKATPQIKVTGAASVTPLATKE